MRPAHVPALLLSFLAFIAAASTARAQATLPSVDVRTWRPSTDGAAGIVVEPVSTPGPWAWNAGTWFNFTYRPITLRGAGTDGVIARPVQTLFGADFTAGLGLGTRAAIGIGVPLFLYQDGTNNLPPTILSTSQVPTSGLGDFTLYGKATVVPNDKGEQGRAGLGLALLGSVGLPTGERTSFMGDGAANVTARLLAEYALVAAS